MAVDGLDRFEKKSSITGIWVTVLIAIIGAAITVGTQYSINSENTRRIQVLETRVDSSMTKDDASEFKRRLERIEDKVDRISQRQSHDKADRN